MYFNFPNSWYLFKNFFGKKPEIQYDFSFRSELDLVPNVPIQSVESDFSWHPSRKWKKRSLSIIDTVIVHQTMACGQTFEQINRYHITPDDKNHISKKGAPHICYHYGVDKDGQCYKFNDEKSITWHCKGSNTTSIGILVNGLFKGPRGIEDFPGDDPTIAQCHNLKRLLDVIAKPYGRNVVGHCEMDPQNKAACPGYGVMGHIKNWISTNRR